MESASGEKISRHRKPFETWLPLTWVLAGQYPALPPPADFCWAVACARREKEAQMWKMSSSREEEESRLATITCPTAHYAAVRGDLNIAKFYHFILQMQIAYPPPFTLFPSSC